MNQSVIFMKKEFLDHVLSGRKTQTIRNWTKCHLHSGSQIQFNFKIPATVLSVKEKYFSQITEDEARKDGFSSLRELKQWFSDNQYSTAGKLYLIEFRLLSA